MSLLLHSCSGPSGLEREASSWPGPGGSLLKLQPSVGGWFFTHVLWQTPDLPSSQLNMKQLLTSLLDNRTWSVLSQNASLEKPLHIDPRNLWLEWWDPTVTIFGCLVVFLVMKARSLQCGKPPFQRIGDEGMAVCWWLPRWLWMPFQIRFKRNI